MFLNLFFVNICPQLEYFISLTTIFPILNYLTTKYFIVRLYFHWYTVPPLLLKMASRRNRFNVQPNKQESTEGHRGKSLSCGNNYFHDFNCKLFIVLQ
jgi:hypothetical protein